MRNAAAHSTFRNGVAAPSLHRVCRKSAAVVHAKLIKGANRPATSKKSSSCKKSQNFEVKLERLCTEADYLPGRQTGPVEVAQKSGRGRGVVAREDIRPGALLFVSEPVGRVLTGQLGQQLEPQHLLEHWQSEGQALTTADRYKLSLLHRPGSDVPLPQVSFKDFSDDKASSKAKKAAGSKGFGAGAATKQAAAGAVAAELSPELLLGVVSVNAHGDDHLDSGLTALRGEQQASIIGVWPEYSLLNHSCAPNTVPPVLVQDRLLLRAATYVPAGQELTTSYLDVAGGMPLQQRRQLLQQHYSFSCTCPRCKAEEAAPADVAATLQAMHDWSSSINTPQFLASLAEGNTSAVQQLHDQASRLVQQLEQQLTQVTEPVAVSWIKASAYGTYALQQRAADWLAGMTGEGAAAQLAELVRVFAPASEPHLQLLLDSALAPETAGQESGSDDRSARATQLIKALVLRYGEVKDVTTLSKLAENVLSGRGPQWLGLVDVDGRLGLDRVMAAANTAGADGGGRRKVELNLQQLGQLESGALQ